MCRSLNDLDVDEFLHVENLKNNFLILEYRTSTDYYHKNETRHETGSCFIPKVNSENVTMSSKVLNFDERFGKYDTPGFGLTKLKNKTLKNQLEDYNLRPVEDSDVYELKDKIKSYLGEMEQRISSFVDSIEESSNFDF